MKRWHKYTIAAVAVAGVITVGIGYSSPSSLCHSNGTLPDNTCTPGVIDPTKTASVLCAPGYTTKSVRPPVSYTNNLKLTQIKDYGYKDTNPASYEEDHLISLELGGSPTDPSNLWPEPYAGTQGAKVKDHIENLLHKRVCSGQMTLQEAQREISTDWTAVK